MVGTDPRRRKMGLVMGGMGIGDQAYPIAEGSGPSHCGIDTVFAGVAP